MLGFIIGFILGSMVGVIVCSLMVAASEGYTLDDEWLELMMQENEIAREIDRSTGATHEDRTNRR